MIAFINFKAIENNSNKFIEEQINMIKTLGNELLVTPISIYDLATIDDILEELIKVENIISIKIWNNKNQLLSQIGDDVNKTEFMREITKYIIYDNIVVGKFYSIWDTTHIQKRIDENRRNTIIIIIIEIIMSIFLSWIIGHKLAYNLTRLKDYAQNLSSNLNTAIPIIHAAKEINILSETFEKMRKDILSNHYDLNRYREMIDDNIIISRTDLTGQIIYVSNAFCIISGYTKGELIGKNQNIVRHPDTSKDIFKNLWKTIKNDYTWNGEIKNLKKDGSFYWVYATISPWIDQNGEKIGYIAIRQDITDKKRVEELSITDKLTQLYNRVKLEEIFYKELSTAQRYNHIFSVIMLDIDHFKSVNDTYGHNVGDTTLQDFAQIVTNSVRTTDIVGRWGGEEFLVIALETNIEDTVKLANIIRINIENYDFKVIGKKTASFGVSTYHKGDTQESIIKRADDGLYEAKSTGRNRVVTLEV
ncbi:MAG: diguanylate cyclase [Sulfurovum sp.]